MSIRRTTESTVPSSTRNKRERSDAVESIRPITPGSMWNTELSLGVIINRTGRSMKRALDAKLSSYGITSPQFIILSSLWAEEGVALRVLGERLYFDNPTLTGIVDRMERDGLLERKRSLEDRRVITIHLTAKGRELRGSIGHLAFQIDNEVLAGFTTTEQQELFHLLHRIWMKLNGNEHDKGTVPDSGKHNGFKRTGDS